MAGTGSTITGTALRGTTTNHTYRITIDISRIRENVYAVEGGKLSDGAVRNWLRSAGFEHESAGDTWVVAEENLRLLDKTEIVRMEQLHADSALSPSH